MLICFKLKSNGPVSSNEDNESTVNEHSETYGETLQIDFSCKYVSKNDGGTRTIVGINRIRRRGFILHEDFFSFD